MPFRFFRRVRIAPGVTINLSKSGPSVSIGPRGAKVTLGHGRVRRTVGLPGTGLYYTSVSSTHERPKAPPEARPEPPPELPAEPPPDAVAASAEPSARAGLSGWWSRRSTSTKVAIVVGALLAAYLVGASSASTPSPAPTGGAGRALGGVGAAPSSERAAAAGDATANPAATPSPIPAAKTSPKATPKPASQPRDSTVGASIPLRVTRLTSPVDRGSRATLAVATAPRAECSIEVDYASGPSSASGLGDKAASSSGGVSWTWTVGTRTTRGTWPISVACSKGDAYASLETRFTVR
jgi:hypothetical protein